MTQLYPPGTTLPIQPWFFESIQRQLNHKKKGARGYGAYQQYLVQRFGVWRVFPVRVGRWMRQSDLSDTSIDDMLSLALAVVTLPMRFGEWKLRDRQVQLIDPLSGAPIAEHELFGVRLHGEEQEAQWRQTQQLALLGDPRVGGLIAPVWADSMKYVYSCSRRGHYFATDVAKFEQKAAQVMNLPYRDFSDRNDGPWVVDHPEKPKGHTNLWKPSPWYRPA